MAIDGWTLLLQVINFLVLAWLLHRLLYRPVLALVEQRRRQVESAFTVAEERERQAGETQQNLDQRLREMHAERDTLLARARADIAAEHERMREQAHEQATQDSQSATERLARERADTAGRLQAEAATLAVDLARTLLAEASQGTLDAGMAVRACERLEQLQPHEIDGLVGDSPDPLALTVATANALPDDERKLLAERLSVRFARPLALEFVVDADLLGGAELRLPHGAISSNWRDVLQDARHTLSGDEQTR